MAQSATLHPSDTACPQPAAHFELRFFLTEAEWREAGTLLHPVVGNGFNKPWVRLFIGCCAVFNLIVPVLNGWSWSDLIRDRPQSAVAIAVGTLVCGFLATGFGLRFLNQRLNRLDLDRHIVVSEQGVRIEWNGRVFHYGWNDFLYFRSNSTLLVLRNSAARVWTIPLRALAPGTEPRFLEFVARKLPRRQPHSWSPDSSGYSH
jgi:hypothetical protein